MKRLLTILIFIPFMAAAQTGEPDSTDRSIVLDETVVSANKVTEQRRDVPQQIESIPRRQIQLANPSTAADLIAQTGQVLVQKSQLGGGSPVLRGFEASRVLLVVDGVRLNNIIYRAGHLQNIITLDPSMLEKVEVLFGPSSTVYGSDALGGVLHFYTRSPKLNLDGDGTAVAGNALIRYSSAMNEKTGHVDFNIGGGKLASWTSLSYADFDYLIQGKNLNKTADSTWLRPYYVERINGQDSLISNNNIYKQIQSGYSQYDVMEKILFRQNENVSHVLNLQFSNSTDVPRYDRLTDPDPETVLRNAEWYYGPQLRTLASYELQVAGAEGLFSHYHANVSYQYIEESRHQRRYDRTGLQHRNEKVGVFGFSVDARRQMGRNDFRTGLDGQFNMLTSTAEEENIETGEIAPLDTRYPDGDNSMNTLGLYATNTYRFNEHWLLNGGLRLEYITLRSTWINKEFFDFPYSEVDQSHFPLSGSLGAIWNGEDNVRVSLLGSTGFRAPNVDDLAKVFESQPGTIIVPNPGLEPERTWNADFMVSKVFADKVKLELVGFYTLFNNAIVTNPFLFNGEDSIIYDGEMSAVYANQNAGEAFLYGGAGNLFVDFTDHFSLTSSLTYTYGRVVTDTANTPLDHIPPLFGKTSFIYRIQSFRGEVFAQYNAWKHIEDYSASGEDNEQYATPEGMPAWWTLNLRLQYVVSKHLTVQAACENILDQNYRVFASGISAPGRNFIVALRGSF